MWQSKALDVRTDKFSPRYSGQILTISQKYVLST
jgi:hypothetical protein